MPMPQRPQKVCAAPGCSQLTRARHCEQHQQTAKETKRQADRRRGSAHSRGYNYDWQQASKRYRQAHPLCEECKRQGKTTPSVLVDHIIPHRGDMDLFWDQGNWQALCQPCHSTKTATEDGGFGNQPQRGRGGQ